MKLVLDNLDSAAAWSTTGSATVIADQWPGTIASGLASSLKFTMPLGSTATLLFGPSASGVTINSGTFIGFNQVKKGAFIDYQESADFVLKMTVVWDIGTKNYFVPLTTLFDRVYFRTEGAATIHQITFTALADCAFFASELTSFTSQYPADIHAGLKAAIEAFAGSGVQCGTITAASGAKQVKITGYSTVERMSVIRFGSETHQIDKFDQDGNATFFPNHDGVSVVSAAVALPVYLLTPVLSNPDNAALTSPGIAVRGGFSPVIFEQLQFSSEANSWDTWNAGDGTKYVGRKGNVWEYEISVDGFSRVHDSLETVARAIQDAFQTGFIWVNGLRTEWLGAGSPVYQDYDALQDDTLLQVTHPYKFRIEDEIRNPVKTADTLTPTVTVYKFVPAGAAA